MALTTPPEKRPYSAETPEVSTCVSATASSMNKLSKSPKMFSVMSTPLIMKTLSKAKPPLIVTCPVLGVLSVTPPASSTIADGFRSTARLSIDWASKLAPTVVVSSAEGASPSTTIVSVAASTSITASERTVPPSGTVAARSTVCMPSRPKRTL